MDVDIRIKEWIFNKSEKIHKPEYVRAEPVGWGVPTIQRLWFGFVLTFLSYPVEYS